MFYSKNDIVTNEKYIRIDLGLILECRCILIKIYILFKLKLKKVQSDFKLESILLPKCSESL